MCDKQTTNDKKLNTDRIITSGYDARGRNSDNDADNQTNLGNPPGSDTSNNNTKE